VERGDQREDDLRGHLAGVVGVELAVLLGSSGFRVGLGEERC
jgi:hypothetical protein